MQEGTVYVFCSDVLSRAVYAALETIFPDDLIGFHSADEKTIYAVSVPGPRFVQEVQLSVLVASCPCDVTYTWWSAAQCRGEMAQ